MHEPTSQQRQAMAARGNVLVVAGAGAGKTRTLVERCLAWILSEEERGSVDEILMVTFTEAAATEMRQRLREGLEAAAEERRSPRLLEQVALLESAHISTLHSFCFHLVSQHFYELELDGPPSVLSAERARLLAAEALDDVFDNVYAGKLAGAAAIEELIKTLGGDWDKPTRELVRRAHDYRHSLRDPKGWLDAQRRRFSQPHADEWAEWLAKALEDWRGEWSGALQFRAAENPIAAKCAGILAGLPKPAGSAEFAGALEAMGKIETPRGSGKYRQAIEEIFAEAEFLRSLCVGEDGAALEEDWRWARPAMLALLDLTEAYGRAYDRAKRLAGGVDFQDLEQGALRVLWNGTQPSAAAGPWRKKFRLIFVDEFQDINGAQEAIIEALGRGGAEANRFLVGDVKQSIYRFRLADPRIFERRRREWHRGEGGAAHSLTENFRSHEGILDFVNALFETLMRPEVGGVKYDEHNRLHFGDRANRGHLASSDAGTARVELHLRHPALRSVEGASDAEAEARLIGLRLRALKDAGTIIHAKDGPRAAGWGDMAVLLRAPRHKVESYVKAFAALGIPLVAARGGFYDTMEARDMLNLLRTLDNPLQDLPLLGAMSSAFGGFRPRDLALVRIGREKGRFWTALTEWRAAAGKGENQEEEMKALFRQVAIFLERIRNWRREARHTGVAACLERALDETNYTAWLAAEERAAQRRGNVERFLQLTRDFGAERGEGLYRFLKLVEAQQDNEIDLEPSAPPAADAVRLMSIHQSKGLEFPIVALGDLGHRFNFRDATGRVILDEEFGLCPQIKPPGSAQFYPSLASWLAAKRQRRETLGEELRLLYVAMTRAMEWLILAGTASEKSIEEKWPKLAEALSNMDGVENANNCLDWIGGWLASPAGTGSKAAPRVVIHGDGDSPPQNIPAAPLEDGGDIAPEILSRMSWVYPFGATTTQPAKTSVSALRRDLASLDDEEAAPWQRPRLRRDLDAAEIGSAHHAFLEAAALDHLASRDGTAAESARLRAEGRLTAAQARALDLDAINAFWASETGRQMLGQKDFLRRELAFTARFAATELASQTLSYLGQSLGAKSAAGEQTEFVVVQGAVDLAAILPKEIWLADFKTDQFAPAELPRRIERHRPQLALYGAALARIYGRPVTRSWLCFLDSREIILL